MSISDEFPLAEGDQPASIDADVEGDNPENVQGEERTLWARLSELGLAEPVVRGGVHIFAVLLLVAVVWGMRNFYLAAQTSDVQLPQTAAFAAPITAPINAPVLQEGNPSDAEPTKLPEYPESPSIFAAGIPRLAMLHTTIPSRPRVDVITYTVQTGDTVFGIAESYGLKPETIFWGNRETLNDNPHNLFAGQVLNILPIDGTYHKWSAGESFTRVAEFYEVDPQDVIDYPGNRLDAFAFDLFNPSLDADTWLIIPGGVREFIDWGPPLIPRSNPAVARTYGPGHCGSVVDGAIGNGTFVWPTIATYLSGYDYSPASNHSGIDIAGPEGNSVFSADAGVVVYAGWSYFGYGNLVVLDHGNGFQSLYAHLSNYYVFCGQSVFQGTSIGTVGNTGNSSGAHLHFELMYNGAKVNPWNYVSP